MLKFKRPKILAYNCQEITAIIRTETLLCSKMYAGVSFTENLQLEAHGPFRIVFKKSPWFTELIPVIYPFCENDVILDQFGNTYTKEEMARIPIGRIYLGQKSQFVRLGSMFKNEQEWWSHEQVSFKAEQIVRIEFMRNSCGHRVMGLRKANTVWHTLNTEFKGVFNCIELDCV